MNTRDKTVLIGTTIWLVVLWWMFPHARFSALFWLALISGAMVWLLLRFGKRKGTAALPESFTASYRSANMALDLERGALWVRPARGKDRVFHRSDLRTWNHVWKEASNTWGQIFKRNNQLVITVADLHSPTVEVHFSSYEEAATWQARIDAWVNG